MVVDSDLTVLIVSERADLVNVLRELPVPYAQLKEIIVVPQSFFFGTSQCALLSDYGYGAAVVDSARESVGVI